MATVSRTDDAIATTDARSICATRAYSIPELAAAWETGRRPLYLAIRNGHLRAAQLNDRGDLRVLGAWALAYLEARAERTVTTPT